METHFLSKLICEHLMDNRFVKLYIPLRYYSKILKRTVTIPEEFICDFESVPIAKGSSKRAGVGHDYFCRKDSEPVVTKKVAADLYFELQELKDKGKELNQKAYRRAWRFIKRHFKTSVVRVAPGYFHKLNVLSPLEEVQGKDG